MKKNYWLFVLLTALVLFVLVLFLVVTRINDARSNLAQTSPGAFNYLLQTNLNLQSFVDGLDESRSHEQGGKDEEALRRIYQQRFDVVWAGFSVFDIDFLFQPKRQEEVKALLDQAKQFLSKSEHLMVSGYQLTDMEADNLIAGAKQLILMTVNLGHQYFIYASHWSDKWNEDMHRLYQLFWISAALLLLTGTLLIALLLRSSEHSADLVEKSHKSQQEMKRLIDELRSGKLESKAKDSFIAAASHDLRQPLHALGLFLGATEKYVDNDAGRQALSEAKHCAEELNKLFNSLLDLSRLDAGVVEVNKKEFKLNRLLRLMEQEFSALASQSGIDFSVSRSLHHVNTDALLLNRILRNLLENAFTHSGASRIAISAERKGGFVILTVSDDGAGIPIDEQSDVFSEYYQLENPERDRSKGLGLGLSIVKRLCEILDVDISLESSSVNGTQFHLLIPTGSGLEGKTQKPVEHSMRDVQSPDGTLVAVIDDDANIRRSMISMLESFNFKVVATESANTMIVALRSRDLTPDILVADYRLREGQTGDVAIHRVRSAFNREIPALIITGDTSPGRMNEAANSGFELMHKPVEPGELMKGICSLLKRNELENA